MSLGHFIKRIFHRRCQPMNVEDASAEKMKYDKVKDKEISQESHALGNAVSHMQGASRDIRRSADALTRLARSRG